MVMYCQALALSAMERCQSVGTQQRLDHMKRNHDTTASWCIFSRGLDVVDLKLSFSPGLRPLFTSWVQEKLADLKNKSEAAGVTDDERSQIKKRISAIAKAVKGGQCTMHVFAQTAHFWWRAGQDCGLEKLFPPIRYLQRTTAECAFDALEGSLPGLATDSILALMPCVFAVGFASSLDSAPSEGKSLNMRDEAIASGCREMGIKNNCVHWRKPCQLHQVDRAAKPTFKGRGLNGPLNNKSKLIQLQTCQERWLSGMMRVIKEDVARAWHPHFPAPPRNRMRMQQIINDTLMTVAEWTLARSHPCWDRDARVRLDRGLAALVEEFLSEWNGDPDAERISRYGGESLELVVEAMQVALTKLVKKLLPPSFVENEWGSVSAHCTFWAFGDLCNDVFRRGWLYAFSGVSA
jgi:hypothetical protein